VTTEPVRTPNQAMSDLFVAECEKVIDGRTVHRYAWAHDGRTGRSRCYCGEHEFAPIDWSAQ
jgi:hypothetical protein